ncbi:MAG: hypothetical protein WCA98_06995 [Candidatus Acidiferrales bacterium]
MPLVVDARTTNLDAFTLEQFALHRAERLADQKFSAGANDAMPGNAASRRAPGHGIARDARTAAKF